MVHVAGIGDGRQHDGEVGVNILGWARFVYVSGLARCRTGYGYIGSLQDTYLFRFTSLARTVDELWQSVTLFQDTR